MTRREHQLMHGIEREIECESEGHDALAAIESKLFDTFASAVAKATGDHTMRTRAT